MAKDTPLDAPISQDTRDFALTVRKRLDSGEAYKVSQGYYDEWAEYQRFWDADQWPAATGDTEDFPRPQTNHYTEIIEMKTAGLNYEKPEIYLQPKKGYLANEFKIPVQPLNPEKEPFEISSAELLTTIMEEIEESNDCLQLYEDLTRSGGVLGDGLVFSAWDNTIRGTGNYSFVGDVVAREIDVTDLYIGDAAERDLQKQPYIMLTERKPLSQVKAEYSEYSKDVEFLQPDAATSKSKRYDHQKHEIAETDYVDIIHYWEKTTASEDSTVSDKEGKVYRKSFLQVDYYVVCQELVIREQKNFYPYSNMYPIAHFSYYPRRKSFYSKSEAKELINNQKELNRLQGIALMGAYKTGLPDLRYKEGFVKVEDLHQGPGGNMIADESPPGTGWGVDYLQPPTIASYIPLLKDSLAQGMRDNSGVHEAWSGKAPSAHLNASAIMALQEAAGVRIRGIQRRLHYAVKEMAEIWLGFIKEHYNEQRMFKVYGPDNNEGIAWYNPEQFKNMEYEVKVNLTSASPYSKTVVASTLERMLELQVIDPDLFIKLFPQEVFPKIKELLMLSEKRIKEQQAMAMQQQIQIVDEMVNQVMEQARASKVPITPEALVEMRTMIQETAKEMEGQV